MKESTRKAMRAAGVPEEMLEFAGQHYEWARASGEGHEVAAVFAAGACCLEPQKEVILNVLADAVALSDGRQWAAISGLLIAAFRQGYHLGKAVGSEFLRGHLKGGSS